MTQERLNELRGQSAPWSYEELLSQPSVRHKRLQRTTRGIKTNWTCKFPFCTKLFAPFQSRCNILLNDECKRPRSNKKIYTNYYTSQQQTIYIRTALKMSFNSQPTCKRY